MTVLDTDVFIDHFRGVEAATAYIQSLEVGQLRPLLSPSWSFIEGQPIAMNCLLSSGFWRGTASRSCQ